jgi:glycosyltransferase involved in cell wall biosynthesis
MLTALMPLKNHHPRYLAKALGSLFAQTYPDWRLLVISEPEDTAALRDALGEALRDSRVRLIANQGKGLSAAFNTGMREASSEFVAILLADDMWTPDAVHVLRESIARHPEADFHHSARRIIDENDAPLSSVYESRETFSREDFLRTSPVKHLLCWRRDFALSIGGMDESLPPVGPDDYDFPWCMADAGAEFRAVPECLYLYRDHRESFRLTTHLPLEVHRAGIRRILEKHGVDPERIAARLAYSEQAYLRQCLYESWADKEAKEASGHDPRTGWRDTYR